MIYLIKCNINKFTVNIMLRSKDQLYFCSSYQFIFTCSILILFSLQKSFLKHYCFIVNSGFLFSIICSFGLAQTLVSSL